MMRMVAFWEQHAHLPADWLHSTTEKTYYLGPEKALELGLVDRVCTKSPDLQGQAIRDRLPQSQRGDNNTR
jgi:ATP-dependent protease ClpP protease subunit